MAEGLGNEGEGEGRERERKWEEGNRMLVYERKGIMCMRMHAHTHTHTHLMFFNLLLQYASVLIWWRHCLQLCALVLHPQHHITVRFLKLTSSLGRREEARKEVREEVWEEVREEGMELLD